MPEDPDKIELLTKFGKDLGKMIHYYSHKCELPMHEIIGMVHITLHTIMTEIEKEIDEGEDLDFPWN